jgi:hypothetical protein
LLLLALYLYEKLPHYVPKGHLRFFGSLHQPLTRTIELSNPSRQPISYQVPYAS